MTKYKVVLFDLDGTLSDPKVGITRSVQYALQQMNIEEPNLDKLDCFIGPPLQESFTEFYSLTEIETKIAIDYYRERFKETGMFENELYKHIPFLLKSLKQKGYVLVVATSKPTIFAEAILKYFAIHDPFDLIVGSNLDGTRTSKTEIIQFILEKYNDYTLEDFIMIGDRKHDLIGANNCGIDSIGVTYGYGTFEELAKENPTAIVNTVEELAVFFMKD